MRKLSKDGNWTKDAEKYIKSIGEKSECYSFICETDRRYYRRISIVFRFTVVAVLYIVGLIQQIYGCTDDTPHYIYSTVCFAAGSIVAAGELLDFRAKANKLQKLSVRFGNIYSDVAQQLQIPRSDRCNPVKYIKDITSTYMKLEDKHPGIRGRTAAKFQREFAEKGLSYPILAGGLISINILTDEKINTASSSNEEDDGSEIYDLPDPVDNVYNNVTYGLSRMSV